MRKIGDHAVVLGASMGGLVAARVLSDVYQHVTVVERDGLPEASESRRGVPQGRHIHVLLPRGAEVLDELFPGFLDGLVATGVPVMRNRSELRFSSRGHLLCMDAWEGDPGYQPSRPHLERHVRDQVRALPNVELVQHCEAVGLVTFSGRHRVAGVRIVRQGQSPTEETLTANLVVDATGRGGRMMTWLPAIGYSPPVEERVPVHIKYVTRHLRIAPGALDRELVVVIGARPGRPRAFILGACEDNRWVLTLAGYGEHQPPDDPEEFLNFARPLVPPHIFAAIQHAEYLSEIFTHRFPASVRRHYERLRRFPDGLLVLGDAMCSFNPIYAQGMTVAVLQGLVLRDTLANGDHALARRFFSAAAKPINVAWQLAVGGDLALPEVEGPRPLAVRIVNAYVGRLLAAAERDQVLTDRFLRVGGLIEPPANLLRPSVIRRVIAGNLRRRRTRSTVTHETSSTQT
ncbi:MAG TPA: 2-polyprenyl-6-methoxyphenol hydroxylase-like oxidoreductase [Mycobacteriales bacterium]|jgi:2-polyprenyl-6-methoxyphenol hydroxylase-like FAD-dependent oxidoreductase|nr:2-polyprenyl-6-methoxyphenol hydroxylase-like oxidoreductase [Mycobacteriales bacterium]